ncbi:hypothetical protein [Botrimarina mediterranea]|uniref:hypothetical protein n=1 Tax=Botrimarina mediterranea TaxID=2528022 RepID=UPI0011A83D63|nr:hypothetical protein [Botrimarina mediterranea]
MRTRLRWLVVGGVLAAMGGNFVWRLADAHLKAEAARQTLAGESAAVVAMRDDWCQHVVPVAITEPGEAGDAARTAAAARLNYAVSRATRGDEKLLRQLAPQVLAAIRAIEGTPTDEGGRWGEWVLRRMSAAIEALPLSERVALLKEIDDTLVVLSETPRLEPVAPQVAIVETPPVAAKPQAADVTAAAAPPAYEMVVRPAPPEPTPAPQAQQTLPAMPSLREVASQWRRPERQLPTEPTEPAEPAPLDQAAVAPADLEDRELLGEALRIESLLAMSADGSPQAMGPSRVPMPLNENEAETRGRLDAVRRELVARGYAGVSRQQVEGLLLPDARERAAFVESLLTDRSGDPARVLLLMAGDESPEVRAAAISALGGSSNRALVTKALELAMRDQDLRVGRLVEPIRERLR